MWTKEKEELLARLAEEKKQELDPKKEAVRDYFGEMIRAYGGGFYFLRLRRC
jgi:hypothetical protein